MEDNALFNASFGLKLSADQVVSEIADFIRIDPKRSYRVIIGTDSLQLRGGVADFVTAIAVHRLGKGGRYFWRRVDKIKFYTLRDRIIHEVMLSLDVAKEILSTLKQEKNIADWGFEIHVDVGENGPSRDFIQELVGMIRANNFEVKTKPDSYVATKVADRHV